MNFIKFFALGFFLCSTTQAYLSVAESGDLLPTGTYKVGVEPQLLTNRGGGANLNVYLDSTFTESTSSRVSLGGGAVDFNAFASVKWIPIPDFDNQPAMGVRFGGGLARDEGRNILQAQFTPLVSKRFDTDYGLTVPYVATPFTFINSKEENFVASNLTLGSEFHYVDLPQAVLGAELGIELNKSYTYFSIFAAFPFESHKGFGK